MIFVSAPVNTTSPTTQAVFLNAHPRSSISLMLTGSARSSGIGVAAPVRVRQSAHVGFRVQ
jgi:hypothetical protein